MRKLLLALALSATVTGCASLPRIAPLPEQVVEADANVQAVTGNLMQLITMAGRAVNSVSIIEDEAAKAGAVPASADAAFDAAMRAYADASDAAAKGLVSGALKTYPELKAAVEPVLQRGQMLIDMASDIGAIKSRASSFLAALRDILSAAAGEFLFGGGR